MKKKRHKLPGDVKEFENQVLAGELPGDVVSGVSEAPVKEHRISDGSSGKGGREGFRIYYFYNDTQITVLYFNARKDTPGNMSFHIRNALTRMNLWDFSISR